MAIRRLAIFLLGIAFCGQLVWSQVNSATISGTVRDASGAVLPGASIAVLNQDTGNTRTVTSNASGRYSAPGLGLGNYQVTAQLAGFQTLVRSGVVLTVGQEAVIDVTLQVGAVTQTVEVTGEAPLIETSNANLGGLIDDQTIRDLPLNARSWDNLALLQPGIVKYGTATGGGFNSGSGTSKFSAAGARSYSNSFLLDGTDVNDSSNSTPGGSAGTNLGVDTIKEFKIVATTFSAEYGRATGAVVSAVTRTGTNQLHGSAFEFLRNSAFDARNFFDRTDLDGDGKADLGPFRRNQFGGTIGGPILRDKTFFFGGYEGLRQARSNTVLARVPTVAAKQGHLVAGDITVAPAIVPYLALYPDPQRVFTDPATGALTDIGEFNHTVPNVVRQDYFMGRVDHQLTGSTSIFGRYQFDDDVNTGSADFNTIVRDVSEKNNARRQYVTLLAHTVISPTLLNAARFALNRSAQFSDAFALTQLAEDLAFVPGKNLMGTITIGEARGDPVFAEVGSDTNYPRFWVYNLWEYGDDMTYVKDRHTFKWGGVLRRIQNNNTVQSEGRGQYTFQGLSNMLTANVDQFRGVPIGEEGYKGIRMTILGAYFQDDFRVSPRLTLNLGLRWETSTDPGESNNQISNLLDALDSDVTVYPDIDSMFKTGDKNFQPRFGFAWQMNDRATSVLRGGFGIYHDLAVPFLFNQQASKYPPFFHRLQIDSDGPGTVPFPNAAPLLSVANAASVQMEPMWPEMPQGAKYNFNLAIQQQWGQRGVFEIGYVGSQARHVTRYQQLNYPNYEIIDGTNYYPRSGLTSANCITPALDNNPSTNPVNNCWTTNVRRRNPAFNRLRVKTNDSNSAYNGLQMKLQRQFAAGPSFQVSYTFSKVMDQQGGLQNGDNGQRDGTSSLDPHDSAREWGRAAHDSTHVMSTNFTYPFPFQFSSGALNAILGGWEVSGLALAMAGQPLTPQLQVDFGRTGNAGAGDRPDLVPGKSLNPIVGTADQWYDPTAFTWPNPLGLAVPQLGFLGNVGRNTIIGPRIMNFDMTLMKNFRFTEETSLQFRAEFFNIFNHTNLGQPGVTPLLDDGFTNLRRGIISYNPSGGQITETSTENREIQFGLKFIF
jgi:hypothetical protein